jgi:hypothetical protein
MHVVFKLHDLHVLFVILLLSILDLLPFHLHLCEVLLR